MSFLHRPLNNHKIFYVKNTFFKKGHFTPHTELKRQYAMYSAETTCIQQTQAINNKTFKLKGRKQTSGYKRQGEMYIMKQM